MSDSAPLGHIKLARKAFDAEHGDPFWLESREFSRWEAWVDMIQLAAFRAHRQSTTHFGVIDLERGEFVASRRWLAKRWSWPEKRVRYFLDTLKNGARIRAQRETQAGEVYLIVNYDTYQATPESKGQRKGPAMGQPGAQQGPKTEAGKAVTTSSTASARSANGGSPASNWVTRLAAFWSEEVGDVQPGRIGAALKSAVDRHGAERVERAMRAYIALQKSDNKPCKLAWFAEQSQVWIERTASPLSVIEGEMSPTLDLLTRPTTHTKASA